MDEMLTSSRGGGYTVCGTGGFFVVGHDWISEPIPKVPKRWL